MPLALVSACKPRSWQPSGRAARIPFAKQPGAMGFRWSKQDSSLLRARAFSSARTTVELRRMLQEYIEKSSSASAAFKQGNIELDLAAFTDLIDNVAPGMGRQEIKALFTSMDTSNDNAIQTEEVFCELTLSILLNRMNAVVNHPLEGSYHCLPCPPFHPDAKQLDAIKVLIKNFDEVVAAQSQPIPPMQLPPLPSKAVSARAQGSLGMFSSLFGGVSKRNGTEKAEEKPKQKSIEFVPTPCAPKGAYLYGGNGCGKTVLLDLFFRSLPEGVSARRLHWQEFLRDAFRAMQGQPPGENIFVAMADSLANKFRVLLLDDIQITHISEAILVKNLFRHLWSRGVCIITTSNYKPHDLYSAGFNREVFVEFPPELEAQCPVIDMSGETDYRLMDVSEGGSTFFSPISAQTTVAFDVAFKQVVGPHVEPDTVPIPQEKREICVPMAGIDVRGAHVARVTFGDLCGQNMGRADYSALVERYHTIFIEAVPKFKPDLGAEFQRFVLAIDILYGKKVSLFLQSEVPARNLFSDSSSVTEFNLDLRMAFRRCSSMLAEMQSPKYQHIVWLMRNHMLQETAMRL